ncbi:hypothetical protein ACWD4N_44665 [Streptomyces sp. NPDC002586]
MRRAEYERDQSQGEQRVALAEYSECQTEGDGGHDQQTCRAVALRDPSTGLQSDDHSGCCGKECHRQVPGPDVRGGLNCRHPRTPRRHHDAEDCEYPNQ